MGLPVPTSSYLLQTDMASHREGRRQGSLGRRGVELSPKMNPCMHNPQPAPSIPQQTAAGYIPRRLPARCPGGLGKPGLSHATQNRLPAHFHLFQISSLIRPHNDSLLMDAAVFITCLN